MTKREKFEGQLAAEYRDLFANDPEYKTIAARTTPEQLAAKMTEGLATSNANKDGEGIRRTCKALRIEYTYKSIEHFLEGNE